MKRSIQSVMSTMKTTETSIEYKIISIERRKDTKNYEKQQAFFIKIIEYIQRTISAENVILMQKIDTHL